jgi:hypothetical protein
MSHGGVSDAGQPHACTHTPKHAPEQAALELQAVVRQQQQRLSGGDARRSPRDCGQQRQRRTGGRCGARVQQPGGSRQRRHARGARSGERPPRAASTVRRDACVRRCDSGGLRSARARAERQRMQQQQHAHARTRSPSRPCRCPRRSGRASSPRSAHARASVCELPHAPRSLRIAAARTRSQRTIHRHGERARAEELRCRCAPLSSTTGRSVSTRAAGLLFAPPSLQYFPLPPARAAGLARRGGVTRPRKLRS